MHTNEDEKPSNTITEAKTQLVLITQKLEIATRRIYGHYAYSDMKPLLDELLICGVAHDGYNEPSHYRESIMFLMAEVKLFLKAMEEVDLLIKN